ncbi:maleylacetate reductase [Rhizobium sp. P40RR-XXII]|uniref:maleylacetate reductase n=1 Tax=unclassified Rhizobium TaxID=2613769 RepID=UPI0014576490|nr:MULTISPECIES: maleylacetate reductase [unclassified Rhizobium]NLR89148.1 maleylacetate reductase [Rhizobium sp. P28RR-XV]NLS21034.1 maleylacetate reductase [Rhizobium sp. P40RR-XXII]
MSLSFSYQGSAAHIVFGNGTSGDVGRWVEALECRRALVLSTPHQASDAQAMSARLGHLSVGTFTEATMHTPVDVTQRAVARAAELGADCVVSLGGGSTTGLGKAMAYRTDIQQIVVPTTYAGSEVTPILGQTENGAKTTLRSPKVTPEVVIYDPQLSFGLPVGMSVTSGLNAIAHAAEGLYAPDRNPITTMMSIDGMRALKDALPVLIGSPRDAAAREKALYGAWLCGTVLGQISMSLHHKICHTLGGTFDTPHAETHSVMLPHTIGFNASAVPDLMMPISDIFGGATPGQALYDFAKSIGAPMALMEFGLSEADLDRAADIATKNPYSNPRPIDRTAIRALLKDAWSGTPPPY